MPSCNQLLAMLVSEANRGLMLRHTHGDLGVVMFYPAPAIKYIGRPVVV